MVSKTLNVEKAIKAFEKMKPECINKENAWHCPDGKSCLVGELDKLFCGGKYQADMWGGGLNVTSRVEEFLFPDERSNLTWGVIDDLVDIHTAYREDRIDFDTMQQAAVDRLGQFEYELEGGQL